MSDEVNNQTAGDPNAGAVFQGITDALGVSNAADGQSQEAEADNQGAVQTGEESLGKFKSQDELLKAYQELERSHTQTRQQLADMQKGNVKPAIQTPVAKPLLDFSSIQVPKEEGSLYPSTEQLLTSSIEKRIGSLTGQLSQQLNPVLTEMQQQIRELNGRLAVADSRSVAVTVAEEFPELKKDDAFRKDVEETMRVMQDKLQLNLNSAQQFDVLLRNACHAVRGKRGYDQSQRIEEEGKAAGKVAMKAMTTGQGAAHGNVQSDADAIREGILNASGGSNRSDSIF